MKTIKEATKELIGAIRESVEYVHYSELREQVEQQPELRQQINDFRVHVFEIQNSIEPLDLYEEQARLCRDYEEFRRNALVNEYLLAELSICRILQKITADVVGAVDLDTDEITQRVGD